MPCATIIVVRIEMPESSAAWLLPPMARMKRPIGWRRSMNHSANAMMMVGAASHGTGPTSSAEPKAFTCPGTP
ncbi:hypothetical protein D3C71_1843220 [compost metagenome]